ncbi:uncharacterized protein CLUP02_03934 [Colletotrichum lupini]|uniref:Uncharacterized protein n=1 Tax=Colletotrichum lupini TaxID=145971 RepID=A0A9Q8WD78_9PEZI|nr:uncharacterized protein CLUP02_03934 [Colletotrichum lupini]UQC78457.1 hypothetical protein CLUP02_03934 [Colletotrichum lupini]
MALILGRSPTLDPMYPVFSLRQTGPAYKCGPMYGYFSLLSIRSTSRNISVSYMLAAFSQLDPQLPTIRYHKAGHQRFGDIAVDSGELLPYYTLPLVILLLLHIAYTQGGPPKSPPKITQTGMARTRPLVSWEGREDVFLHSRWLGEFWQSVIGWTNEKRRITTTLPLAPGWATGNARRAQNATRSPKGFGNNKNTTTTFNPPLTVPVHQCRARAKARALQIQPPHTPYNFRIPSSTLNMIISILVHAENNTVTCNRHSHAAPGIGPGTTCSTRNVDPSRVKQTSKEAETKHLNVRAPKLARARLSDLTLPSLHGSHTPLQPPSPEDPYAWYTTALASSSGSMHTPTPKPTRLQSPTRWDEMQILRLDQCHQPITRSHQGTHTTDRHGGTTTCLANIPGQSPSGSPQSCLWSCLSPFCSADCGASAVVSHRLLPHHGGFAMLEMVRAISHACSVRPPPPTPCARDKAHSFDGRLEHTGVIAAAALDPKGLGVRVVTDKGDIRWRGEAVRDGLRSLVTSATPYQQTRNTSRSWCRSGIRPLTSYTRALYSVFTTVIPHTHIVRIQSPIQPSLRSDLILRLVDIAMLMTSLELPFFTPSFFIHTRPFCSSFDFEP